MTDPHEATEPQPLQASHLHDLRFISAPTLSPDGARAVYVASEIVPGSGDAPPRYRHRLRLVDLDDGRDRPFTAGEADRSPQWSPAGDAVAFLAPLRAEATKPDAAAQLHVIATSGGEARALTDFAAGVLGHRWLPSGDALVMTRGDWLDEADTKGLGRVIEARQHRQDGVGWVKTGTVEAWRVGEGDAERLWTFDMAPSSLDVAPDGERVVYLAPRDQDEADMGRSRLWSRPLSGGDAVDLLGRSGTFSDPSVSPDARLVAFYEPADPEDFGSPATLCVVAAGGGESRPLTQDVAAAPSVAGDTRIGEHPVTPRWDGDGLVIAINREGRSALARVDLTGAVSDGVGGDRVVTAFDARAGRKLAIVETPTRTAQLHVVDEDGRERCLTSWNDELLAGLTSGEPMPGRTITGGDAQELTYWRIEPRTPRADRALVVQVHGGPHTNYGYGFVFEFHLLAAAGYTVVYGNPRGGSSFGAAFAGAIRGAYGTVDADDVLAIVDDALARHERPDAPVHLTGGSYGGFMTNWLVGHTDRFRSAVTQRSICNWTSFYGTSDIGPYFAENELGTAPWDDAERLWDRSPLKYVANVRTPTLIIHSEGDHRCPIEQAEQWFSALKRLDQAPTRLLRFPDEGHELSRSGRPDRRVQRLEAIVGWFEEHA